MGHVFKTLSRFTFDRTPFHRMAQALIRAQQIIRRVLPHDTLQHGHSLEGAWRTGDSASAHNHAMFQPPLNQVSFPSIGLGPFAPSLMSAAKVNLPPDEVLVGGIISAQQNKERSIVPEGTSQPGHSSFITMMGKTELNSEQRTAIRMMLSGAGRINFGPPFVLFGPPGDE
jgi:hypothetical protein